MLVCITLKPPVPHMIIPIHRLRSFFLVLLCLLGLASGCNSEQAAKNVQPLIQINDKAISKAEFLAEFEKSLQKDQPLSNIEREELQRSFLVQLIDRELIHAEARRLEISVTDADVDAALESYRKDYPGSSFETMLQDRGLSMAAWREELRESLIMEKLMEQAVYPSASVTDEEVAGYYEANRDQFDRPAQVRARQIVVATEADGQKVLGLLRQGVPFAEVAAQYSLSPDAQQGGDLGFFARGQMPPEFDDVVFDLPVNRLSDLVKSDYGYHIFLVEEKRKAMRLSKQDAAAEIRATLEATMKEELYLRWLQDMRAKAVIAVDWPQLEKAGQKAK